MINLIRKAAMRAHSRYLSWKWDRAAIAAERRFQGCAHEHTIFVDVGSPPYNCTEKCRDCWAIRVPKVGFYAPSNEMYWTPNCANPRRAQRVAPPHEDPL